MTISVTVANATTRKTVVVDDAQTIKQVLTDNGMAVDGVTVHANGTPKTDLNQSLAAAGIGDGTMLMSVAFQKAGAN